MARLLEHIPVEEEPKIASQAADAPEIPGVEVEKITLVRTIGGMFQRHDDGEAPLLIQVHDPDQTPHRKHDVLHQGKCVRQDLVDKTPRAPLSTRADHINPILRREDVVNKDRGTCKNGARTVHSTDCSGSVPHDRIVAAAPVDSRPVLQR
jgi:hypothetical protein